MEAELDTIHDLPGSLGPQCTPRPDVLLSSLSKPSLNGVALKRTGLRQKDKVPCNMGGVTPFQLPGREVLTEAFSLLLLHCSAVGSTSRSRHSPETAQRMKRTKCPRSKSTAARKGVAPGVGVGGQELGWEAAPHFCSVACEARGMGPAPPRQPGRKDVYTRAGTVAHHLGEAKWQRS